jgi:hypothetical protein
MSATAVTRPTLGTDINRWRVSSRAISETSSSARRIFWFRASIPSVPEIAV